MPTVEINFSPLPVHVRTARLIAVAVARRASVAEEALDELRLAVGEACSRAVAIHAENAPDEPVTLLLSDDDGRFSVDVIDRGPHDVGPGDGRPLDAAFERLERIGETAAASPGAAVDQELLPSGFGLAVIAGLVDELDVQTMLPVGTRVRMVWPAGERAADSLLAAERLAADRLGAHRQADA